MNLSYCTQVARPRRVRLPSSVSPLERPERRYEENQEAHLEDAPRRKDAPLEAASQRRDDDEFWSDTIWRSERKQAASYPLRGARRSAFRGLWRAPTSLLRQGAPYVLYTIHIRRRASTIRTRTAMTRTPAASSTESQEPTRPSSTPSNAATTTRRTSSRPSQIPTEERHIRIWRAVAQWADFKS